MIFSRKEINYRYQINFNGKEKQRLGVAVAVINEKDQILLEQRRDCGWWGVTGGKLDEGETIEECAIREIHEESNIDIDPKDLKLIGVYSNPKEGRILQYHDNRVHLIDIVFYTRISQIMNIKISNESLKLEFFNFKNLPKLIVPPAIKPLKDIQKIFL